MLKIVSHESEWCPKYYGIIVGLFCSLYMITLCLSIKIFDFHGATLPAGILVFPLCAILADILTEVYGFKRTRQAIWAALASTVLFAVFTQAALKLTPAPFWEHQKDFENVFNFSWRISLAGCMAWVVGEISNSYILSRMKLAQKGKHMSVRFIASTVIGQFFDTFIFILVAFGGLITWNAFFLMALTGWGAKVLYEILFLPASISITKRIKRAEGVDHFDPQ